MILFYYGVDTYNHVTGTEFQFHYDLILLGLTASAVKDEVRFQFHYDLILLEQEKLEKNLQELFQFHYDLILFKFKSTT